LAAEGVKYIYSYFSIRADEYYMQLVIEVSCNDVLLNAAPNVYMRRYHNTQIL